MDASTNPEFDQHQELHRFHDPDSGLRVIIAIHSTALGPGAGGCRRWIYHSEEDAVTDALRLSRGMTYKNAMAGLPFGGGKAVVLANPNRSKTAEQFEAFGTFVDSLQGRYITAEDVGVTTQDMLAVRRQTRFVSGLPRTGGAVGGDPSPWTALGVFLSMREAVRLQSGADTMCGLRVAVQGVGSVGYHLCKLLFEDGASLLVADINVDSVQRAVRDFAATAVPPDDILFADAEVLSPCALGAVFDERSVEKVRASIIAGAANNQLATEQDGFRLNDRGKLYLPDYVINSGGIIAVAREYIGGCSRAKLETEVRNIPSTLRKVLRTAQQENLPPHVVADAMA